MGVFRLVAVFRPASRLPSITLSSSLFVTLSLCACASASEQESLPCDVEAVLKSVCQQCHTRPPRDGVPISLVTYADTQASYTQRPDYVDTPTFQVMRDMLDAGLMPQPPVTITDAQRATLLDWIDAGAPPAAESTSCR